ncbi:MAG TPA: c-type cytochrome domain-containing protein, partial [Candidatus Angelobacter sp.]|nr:c-type cytochrome domain-containing protein [Candidatus Angelobacter sp.]
MSHAGLRCYFRILLGAVALRTVAAPIAGPRPEEIEFFEQKIRPVLVERCYKCHSTSSEKIKGDLLLDTRAGMLKGGESGKPAILAGDPERSRLIEAIRYTNDDLQMPPKKAGGKLGDEQIAD